MLLDILSVLGPATMRHRAMQNCLAPSVSWDGRTRLWAGQCLCGRGDAQAKTTQVPG